MTTYLDHAPVLALAAKTGHFITPLDLKLPQTGTVWWKQVE